MSEHSAAPGTPQTYAKAIWGAITAFIIAGGPTLYIALSDNHVTTQEGIAFVLAGLGAPIAVGAAVAKAKNKPLRGREVVPR